MVSCAGVAGSSTIAGASPASAVTAMAVSERVADGRRGGAGGALRSKVTPAAASASARAALAGGASPLRTRLSGAGGAPGGSV